MRPIYLPGVLVFVLLAACDQPAPPKPAASPTPAVNAGLIATRTALAAGLVAVPTVPATLMPTPQRAAGAAAPAGKPDLSRELADYFTEFYNTRTLQRGGVLSPNWVRNILDEPYLDYAISQVRKDASEADAGRVPEDTHTHNSPPPG